MMAHYVDKLTLQEAKSLAHTALGHIMVLDPNNIALKYRVANFDYQFNLDYERSKATFDQFLKLAPENRWISYFLGSLALREGRTSKAIRYLVTAVDHGANRGLEHVAILITSSLIRCLANDCERTLEDSREALRLAEGGQERADCLWGYAFSLIMLDRIEETRPFVEELWDLDGIAYPARGFALFALLGETERAHNILSDPRYELVGGFNLAIGHLALGDIDSTFRSIKAGIENQNGFLLDSLSVAKMWDPIRDDPRFGEMLDLLDSKVTHTKQYLRDHQIEQ
ncbi:MAG TPA: tetratricopeptide repeat protein [Dehalococcoidia bacterium]|nr:tetratricopeptide repeat protein [Dehalococcoidia bacterium]